MEVDKVMRRVFKRRRFFEDRLKEDMKDPEFRKAFEEADLPVRLAIEIAKLRKKRGLSQKELARKAKTKQQVISRIENLDQTNLTMGTLQKIAQALNVQVSVSFR